MRRAVGISSLERHNATAAQFESLSVALSAGQVEALEAQLVTFQAALRSFATKHGPAIRADPAFRTAFSTMCAELGVDPLGGGRKGIWDHVGVGQWTYELAVQVVDVCLRHKALNGGLMDMEEVLRGVRKLRRGPAAQRSVGAGGQPVWPTRDLRDAVTEADVARALEALKPFGFDCYSIVTAGHRKMVRSVASAFDTDSMAVAASAFDGKGFTTHAQLCRSTGWTPTRARDAIDAALLRDGLVWLDGQAESDVRLFVSPPGSRFLPLGPCGLSICPDTRTFCLHLMAFYHQISSNAYPRNA